MPFGHKPNLRGLLWTVPGTAGLTAAQHRVVDTAPGMCCEFCNSLLESWRGEFRWRQSRHGFDGVKVADAYDKGRVCGDRGSLYSQFSEMRHSEQPLDGEDGLLSPRPAAVSAVQHEGSVRCTPMPTAPVPLPQCHAVGYLEGGAAGAWHKG